MTVNTVDKTLFSKLNCKLLRNLRTYYTFTLMHLVHVSTLHSCYVKVAVAVVAIYPRAFLFQWLLFFDIAYLH